MIKNKKAFSYLPLIALILVIIFIIGLVAVPKFKSSVFHSKVTGNAYLLPPPSKEESKNPIGVAITSPPSKAYKFLQIGIDGSPIRYDPCRPVHYVVNPLNSPAFGDRIVKEAIAEVSRYSGLQFIYDGPTKELYTTDRQAYQPLVYGKRWAPVLITWSTAKQRPELIADGAGKVLGEGGSVSFALENSPTIYVSGRLDIEIENLASVVKESDGDVRVKAIILHELGHLLGLDHPDDPWQIMFPEASMQVTDFNIGDKAGLAELGRGPCNPKI